MLRPGKTGHFVYFTVDAPDFTSFLPIAIARFACETSFEKSRTIAYIPTDNQYQKQMAARITSMRLAFPTAVFDVATPCTARVHLASRRIQQSAFSTSQARHYPRDRNPNRGISAVRRTGLRQPLSVSKEPLPEPVLDRSKRTPVDVDPNHGLWGFFGAEKKALQTPEEDFAHGVK